jgi:hypothetical protein
MRSQGPRPMRTRRGCAIAGAGAKTEGSR